MNEVFGDAVIVTGGALTCGLGILVGYITIWYFKGSSKGSILDKLKNSWRSLILPMIPLAIYGVLLIQTVGGVLGGGANAGLRGANELGDASLEYGVGGESFPVDQSDSLVLGQTGHVVVILATVVIGVMLYVGAMSRIDILLMTFMGVCLGKSAGAIGWTGGLLGSAVDTAGAFIMTL